MAMNSVPRTGTRYATPPCSECSRLTPRMIRVVFGGPALAGLQLERPAAHIKLILGQTAPEHARAVAHLHAAAFRCRARTS